MAHLTSFEKRLDRLFLDRTYNLRSRLGLKKRGPKPQLTRKKVNKTIDELQNLASNILAKGLAKNEFKENVRNKKGRKIKGRGGKSRNYYLNNGLRKISQNKMNLYTSSGIREGVYMLEELGGVDQDLLRILVKSGVKLQELIFIL